MRRILLCFIVLSLLLSGCSFSSPKLQGVQISLSDSKITVDGNEITNDRSKAVYAANDIVFYLAGQDAAYGEGTPEDAHEQNEADAHTVVHITKPGTYILSGALSLGQIAIDLGEDAEENGVSIIGDLPIYVALDSADVWANSELFELDDKKIPINVAGCPPDAFSEKGQLWGNPLYKWEIHKNTNYDWWKRRLSKAFEMFPLAF